jgi:hypothetical protein
VAVVVEKNENGVKHEGKGRANKHHISAATSRLPRKVMLNERIRVSRIDMNMWRRRGSGKVWKGLTLEVLSVAFQRHYKQGNTPSTAAITTRNKAVSVALVKLKRNQVVKSTVEGGVLNINLPFSLSTGLLSEPEEAFSKVFPSLRNILWFPCDR